MSIENIYSYLEYLALTIEQLEQAVTVQELDISQFEARISEMNQSLSQAQTLRDAAEAKADLLESKLKNAEEKILELQLVAKAVKQTKAKDGQTDLFAAAPLVPAPAAPPVPKQPHRVANDESALILAKKLDSTIDKVQRLIREARA